MNIPTTCSGELFQFGIIGDLHSHWDHVDLRQFASADYDLLFFTGDLGGGSQDSSLKMARSMAQLSQPTLVMPGNNDTDDIVRLAAELAHQRGLNQLLSLTSSSATQRQPISLCGYSEHRIQVGNRVISLIAARPHSMGGPNLSFPEFMAASYAITSLQESASRIKQLVEQAADEIIFLSHNGPKGLGEMEHDMWGCDFKADGGDWGDPDLALAISHAKSSGKQVLAVVAGHMHLRTKQGLERPWLKSVDETVYVNAARVPRIFSGSDDVYRHHVRLTISETELIAEEVLVPEYGE
ncbi:MAG: metallophosphoesterase [Pseudomonadales bacterium]